MQTKHFYTNLVETTDITLEIAQMDLTPNERVHLISLMEANIHSVVVKKVLSELPNEDKKVFLKNLTSSDHAKTWEHLKKTSFDMEEKIKSAIEELKKELIDDIKSTKAK
jgi:hypothetical protein